MSIAPSKIDVGSSTLIVQSYNDKSILKSTLREDTITITVIALPTEIVPVNPDQATNHTSSATDASVKLGLPQEIRQEFSVG